MRKEFTGEVDLQEMFIYMWERRIVM